MFGENNVATDNLLILKMSYQQMEETPTSSLRTSMDGLNELRRPLRRASSVYSTYVPNKRFSRYNNAFYSVMPFVNKSNEELYVQHCNPLCFITFHWIWKYLWDSLKNNMPTEAPKCPKIDSSKENSKRLDGLLSNQYINQGKIGSSMLRVVLKFIRTRAIFASLLYISASFLSIAGLIFFLPRIFCVSDNQMINECYQPLVYFFALICTELIACLLYSGSVAINLRTAIRLRSACFASLYKQAMSILLTYKLSSWQLVNFLLTDGQYIQELVMSIPNLICTPIVILFCMVFAGSHLTPHLWGYLSVAFVFLFFPIFIIIGLLSKNLLNKASLFSEKRINLLEEYIVKNFYVKTMNQGEHFETSIEDNRKKELTHLKNAGFYDLFCFSCIQLQPVICLCLLFVTYKVDSTDFKLSEFAAICVILLIHVKQSLETFWNSLNNFIKGLAALTKYKNIMTLETVALNKISTLNENTVISIKGGSFQWIKEDTLIRTNTVKYKTRKDYLHLSNKEFTTDVICEIDLDIKNNELIGICGAPGSGKTSLLLSIMGLLLQSKGERHIKGSFAYVSEQPSIFNDTLKNNIVLGREFDKTLYFRSTMLSGLIDDVANFYNNDDSLISPRNLTFEQKQKVSLARALYSDSDIYLLDQPFSSFSFEKKMEMFETYVKKSLENKTRIIVTDQTEFLEQCDKIYFLQEGIILLEGSYKELMAYEEFSDFFQHLEGHSSYSRNKSELHNTMPEVLFTPSIHSFESHMCLNQSTNSLDSADSTNCPFKKKETQNISKQEVFNSIIGVYIRSMLSWDSAIFLFGQFLNCFIISFLPIYFIYSLEHKTREIYLLSIYFALFVFMLLMTVIVNYIFNKKIMSISVVFHDEMMFKLFHATLSFFQGMALAIISTGLLYLNLTDIQIPRIIHNIILNGFVVFLTLCLMFLTAPWYIINVVLFLILMLGVTYAVRKALLSFNESTMDNCDRLYNQIVNVLSNRSTIQAYNRIHYFSSKLYEVHDEYICYTYIIDAGKYWLNYFLQSILVILLGSVIGCAMLFLKEGQFCYICDLLVTPTLSQETSGDINEENRNLNSILFLPLTIVCIFQVCFSLHKLLLSYVNSGLLFDLTTRAHIFKQKIPQEPEQTILEKEQVFIDKHNNEISFYDVTFCIQDDNIPILKDFSFTINSKEKIGFLNTSVTERKAIIAILYRLSNISFGNVKFGNSFFMEIPIENLRSSITIIPAEPYLFKNTVRDILTNRNNASVENIVNILQRFSLFEYIDQLPNKLDCIAEKYLTTDKKQILLLIQAYVRQSPIIIIEDVGVGSYFEFILRTHIREMLQDSTIIIFGNDNQCFLLCERIVCIKQGKVSKVEVLVQNEYKPETYGAQVLQPYL